MILLLISNICFADDSRNSESKLSDTNLYWSKYLEKVEPILNRVQNIEADKVEISKKLDEILKATEQYDQAHEKFSNPKIAEAEKSILEKKLNELGTEVDLLRKQFLEKFQLIGYELLKEFYTNYDSKKKSKGKKDRLVVQKTVDQFLKEKQFKGHHIFSLIDGKCIDNKKFNELCLKNWISICSKSFASTEKNSYVNMLMKI